MSNSTHLEGSPALSYDSHESSGSEFASRAGGTHRQSTLNTTSFETDLSSPLPNRHSDRSNAYAGDAKFEKYVQLVGRNLQSFDYVQEWADVTAFLTRLSRSFEIYSMYTVVPHKITVTKRLAQCLNPALPTGVHQKTLSIYEQLCRLIGHDGLVADLPLYALGLFPFMRNASLKAKPQLLGILEDYFVPLGPGLRPCLKSIMVGVLPGLEEASADVGGRVVGLLDRLRDTVDAPFFFQTLFLIMVTNAEQRESALKYLAQRLPVFTRRSDVAVVCGEGDDAALMARALAATLTDSRTLVLRAVLDLVMTRFPLRTTVFKAKDVVLVMKHAAQVVLKKDMSLNRRLYTWLLGAGESEAEQSEYFGQYAQQHLADALLGSFAAMSALPDHQHTVLRVLIGLTDKQAISQPVLDAIFVPLMKLLMAERDNSVERTLSVRLASVSRMFVEMLDPFFTWSNMANQLMDAVAEAPADVQRITRALELVQFFVQTFELDDDATLQVHVPMALLSVLAALDRLLERGAMESLSCSFARIAIELFTRIPQSLFLATPVVEAVSVDMLFDTTRSFYSAHRHEESEALIVQGPGLLYVIIRVCKDIVAQLGQQQQVVGLEDVCHILRTAAAYSHDLVATAGSSEPWVGVFIDIVCDSCEFSAVNVALSTLLEFVRRGSLDRSVLANSDTLGKFVERLWATLSPEYVADHYQATQLLWQLCGQLDARSVERHLAAKLASSDYSEAGQSTYSRELAHFAVLWHNLWLVHRTQGDNHDSPLAFSGLLLLVIDNAAPPDVARLGGGDYAAGLERQAAARAWIDSSVGSWEHVVETLLLLLVQRQEGAEAFDYGLAVYYMDSLQRYLASAGDDVIWAMQARPPTSPAVRRECEALLGSGSSWLQALVAVTAEFALTDASDATRTRAAELAAYLVAQPHVIWPRQLVGALQGRLVDALLLCVLSHRTLVQPPLLDLLTSLCRAHISEDTAAGLELVPDLALLSRLVLAALTTQPTTTTLAKWAKALAAMQPFIQDHIGASQAGSQDLMELMVLPCVHALRDLLSPSQTDHVPPLLSKKGVVDVLATLLDVFDMFLSLALHNADRIPAADEGLGLVATLATLRDVWRAFEGGCGHVRRAIHSHIARIVEHASQAQPVEVAEATVALWTADNSQWLTRLDASVRRGVGHDSRRRNSSASSASIHRDPVPEDDGAEWSWGATDLLETAPGRKPLAVVVGLLSALHTRSVDSAPGASTIRLSSVDDIALIRFIELYARHRLAAREAAPLEPHVLAMLRDYNANALQHKLALPFLLRMFTELVERVVAATHHSPLDPDLCAAYARLVDNCILVAGRALDQTTWLRRSDSAAAAAVRVVRAGDASHTLGEDDSIAHILAYVAAAVLPQLAHLVPDYDRQAAIAANLVHYAVAPAFKSHMTGGYSGPALALASRSQHFALVLRCLAALSHQPSLIKVWKRDVWDFFCDQKFFPSSFAPSSDNYYPTMSPVLAPLWRHLVRTLLVSEKERFAEVLAKVSSASSGPALFANREHEAQMRALSLRRLSFVVWAGQVNQYLASLPQIQEKLVDILKNAPPHPSVQIEVFMCLRVLLCRVSSHHMSNFWPMLLTELMRLFREQLNREEREDPDQANLFLAACKFLDLLFILGTDDFLVHQWMFITDTIDALHGSRSSSSALLDQLSSRLLSMPAASRKTTNALFDTYPPVLMSDTDDDPTNLVYHQMSLKGMATARTLGLDPADLQALGACPMKRPIIRVRSVTSIRELDAFVHNASVQAYQAAFTLAEPDTEFIEALLVSDLMYFDLSVSMSSSAVAAAPVSSAYIGEYDY
ncbi:hypothetical protein GGI20_002456 [Coemansia sp. BCRC 34301]|nr:hypothetical protein GGI20_002456 [Coemansia sp. BCRC 34301]